MNLYKLFFISLSLFVLSLIAPSSIYASTNTMEVISFDNGADNPPYYTYQVAYFPPTGYDGCAYTHLYNYPSLTIQQTTGYSVFGEWSCQPYGRGILFSTAIPDGDYQLDLYTNNGNNWLSQPFHQSGSTIFPYGTSTPTPTPTVAPTTIPTPTPTPITSTMEVISYDNGVINPPYYTYQLAYFPPTGYDGCAYTHLYNYPSLTIQDTAIGFDVFGGENACQPYGRGILFSTPVPDGDYQLDLYVNNGNNWLSQPFHQSGSTIFPYGIPVVGSITASLNPVQVNTAISATASFTDVNASDIHTAVWDWGDGNTTSGIVTESNGSGSVSNNHTYTSAGVYEVILTVTDNDNGVGSNTYQYAVVYDTSAGFLTGAGKFDSPSPTGVVKFGINAKYIGTSTPTGQTKVSFDVGNIELDSTSYQWLVVSGAKATLKGNGTVNGSGNYTFIISGIDGSQTGGQNLIRVRIADSSNNVIYDTQPGASDTANPTTPLSNGIVKVH